MPNLVAKEPRLIARSGRLVAKLASEPTMNIFLFIFTPLEQNAVIFDYRLLSFMLAYKHRYHEAN